MDLTVLRKLYAELNAQISSHTVEYCKTKRELERLIKQEEEYELIRIQIELDDLKKKEEKENGEKTEH